MREVWKKEKMLSEIVGMTPTDVRVIGGKRLRGLEIESYLAARNFHHINYSVDKQLEYMKKSNISNYIIIDDDSDMLYNQRNHFVHVLSDHSNKSGFNEFYYEQALEKLKKTIIKLNYERN